MGKVLDNMKIFFDFKKEIIFAILFSCVFCEKFAWAGTDCLTERQISEITSNFPSKLDDVPFMQSFVSDDLLMSSNYDGLKSEDVDKLNDRDKVRMFVTVLKNNGIDIKATNMRVFYYHKNSKPNINNGYSSSVFKNSECSVGVSFFIEKKSRCYNGKLLNSLAVDFYTIKGKLSLTRLAAYSEPCQ